MFILSCNESIDKGEVTFKVNSEIKGQTFLDGNNTSEEYSPSGSFIEIVPSRLRFWKGVQLFQNKKEFIQKEFFTEKGTTILFDSLNNGEYQIKFISHFNDEKEEKILLEDSLKKEFPIELEDYYEINEFDEFSLEQLNSNDTLQILYQYFGCFSFEHNLIEYVFEESNTKVRVADWANNWKEVKIENPIDILNKLIKEGKELNGIEGCSNYDYYTFRKKGENILSIIEDGSCNWRGIGMIIKK